MNCNKWFLKILLFFLRIGNVVMNRKGYINAYFSKLLVSHTNNAQET